jgi:hypothetical protein
MVNVEVHVQCAERLVSLALRKEGKLLLSVINLGLLYLMDTFANAQILLS